MTPATASMDEGPPNTPNITIPQGSSNTETSTGNGSALAKVQTTTVGIPKKSTGKVILPSEITNKIIAMAMTAMEGKIRLPCLTNAFYKPNIVVGCLGVNHEWYHEARRVLYHNNSFTFAHMGSDIKILNKNVGLYACRQQAGGCEAGPPIFNNVAFVLGDPRSAEIAAYNLQAFECALTYMRTPMHVNTLHLHIELLAWRSNAQMYSFAAAIPNVIVREKLIIHGLDLHLGFNLRHIVASLGMKIQPINTMIEPREPGRNDLGRFESHYVPAIRTKELDETFVQPGEIIVDAGFRFRELKKQDKEEYYRDLWLF